MTADFDPLILKMRRLLREIDRTVELQHVEKRAWKRGTVLDTLIEWADDGMRTGHQLDAIVDAARDVR